MSADQNTFRILVATDIHLGFRHLDPIRKDDSLNTFEEILQQAHQHHADFVLLGGDLFHDNRPPRPVLVDCMNLLKTYCLHDGIADSRREANGAGGSCSLGPSFRVLRGGVDNSSLDVEAATGVPSVAAAEAAARRRQQERHNVSLPVFTIHGNHDEPTGPRQLSVLHVLDTAGLLTYFGKAAPLAPNKQLLVKPLLLQKGSSRLALYGLGYVRSNKLSKKFQSGGVVFVPPDAADEPPRQEGTEEAEEGGGETMETEDTEGEGKGKVDVGQSGGEEGTDDNESEGDQSEQVCKLNVGEEESEDWFRLLVLHQNRVHRPNDDTHIDEHLLEGLADLVIWGHEHESRIRPVQAKRRPAWATGMSKGGSDDNQGRSGRTWISQPGSSIATQFSKHEQKQKFIGLLEICGKSFSIRKIPLQTLRQMYMHDLEWNESESLLRDVCGDIVENLLNQAELARKPHNPKEPLIRIKVPDAKSFDQFSNVRFGKAFEGRVANPESIVAFGTKKRNAGGDGSGYAYPENTDTALFSVQQLFEKELVKAGGLQVLRETEGFRSAVEDYVRFADKDNASGRVIDVFRSSLTEVQRRIKDDLTLADHDGENAVLEYLRKASTGLDAVPHGLALPSQGGQAGHAGPQPTPALVDVACDDDVIIVSDEDVSEEPVMTPSRTASGSALPTDKIPAAKAEQSLSRAASVSPSSKSLSSSLTSNSAAKSTRGSLGGQATSHSSKSVSQTKNGLLLTLLKSASTPAFTSSIRSSALPPSSSSASSYLPGAAAGANSDQSPLSLSKGKPPMKLPTSSSAPLPSTSTKRSPSSRVSASQLPSSSITSPAAVTAAAGFSSSPRKHSAAAPAEEPPTKQSRLSSLPSPHSGHGLPGTPPRCKSPSTLLSEGKTLRRQLHQRMIDAPRSGTAENSPKTKIESKSATSGRSDSAISTVRRQLEFSSAATDKGPEVIVLEDDDFLGFVSEEDDLLDSDGIGEWDSSSSEFSGQADVRSSTVSNGGLNKGRSSDNAPGVAGVRESPRLRAGNGSSVPAGRLEAGENGASPALATPAPDPRPKAGNGSSVPAGRLQAFENGASPIPATPAPGPEDGSSLEVDEACNIILAGDDVLWLDKWL